MKGKKNLRTAQHTGRRSANSLGCSTAQCTEKMNSGMREGVWNYRGKEAIQAWTLPSVSPLQVFPCQWEVTLENMKNGVGKQNSLGNIQFQGLEKRAEEDPEAEFLTSRRILRDI